MSRPNPDVARILGAITIIACVAAVFDPHFRRLCMGLLCKLQ